MKRFLLVIFYSLFVFHYSFSQTPGQWVWIKGDSLPNSMGNYGAQGVPSPTNEPPSMYEGNQFTDTSGHFWLLGGSWGSNNYFADLWEYDPATNIWTWMKGPGTVSYPGSFGTKGIPALSNNPPYANFGAASWVDLNGDLWTFGGYNSYCDMWRYHIATNEWTWMNGPGTSGQAGVYGTQGVSNPANHPGYRWESAANWTDDNGDLWLFGGTGSLNDLWKYNVSTNEWAWMKGANGSFQASVFGVQGVEAPNNTPGSRGAYSNWKDNSGHLWLFAGGWTAENDLWRYNIATNNWAWMKGDTLNQSPGNYGTKCVSTPSTSPGVRFENRAKWTDSNGNFWTHGGVLNTGWMDTKNDLWMYSPVTNQWKWISGDTTVAPTGLWGTQGVSAPANHPSGRSGNIGWYDGHCHLYMFGGGAGSGLSIMYNDLWIYTIDSTCGGGCSQNATMPQANFNCSDTTFCTETGECINFFDHSTGNPTSWQWSFPGGSPSSSTLQNPDSICYFTPGTYPVQLIVSNGTNYDTLTVSPLIIFGSAPAPPTITLIGGDTLVSSHAATYQWYYNGAPIAGATDSFYVEHQGGTYAVQITDVTGGCNSISNGFTITGIEELNSNGDIRIYPNPASQSITITWQSVVRGNIDITVANVLGEKIFTEQRQTLNSRYQIVLDVSSLTNGIYFLKIESEGQLVNRKFVVLKK